MAKELPYFKFEPNEWSSGMIQLCSLQSKGLFIELCCLYWSRLGNLPYALALQKLCMGNVDALQELENNGLYDLENDMIVINFLDEQLNEFQDTSEKRRKAANERWKNASAMQVHSKSNAIREDKRREDKIKEDRFNEFWNLYDNKKDKSESLKLWKKLDEIDIEEIFRVVPAYVANTPDKKFRKSPKNYLKGRIWEDEITGDIKPPKKDIEELPIPTEREMHDWFEKNHPYHLNQGCNAYFYYSNHDWHDRSGNKIKNWQEALSREYAIDKNHKKHMR